MLRIIHTGRAYEVWDIGSVTYCKRLPDDYRELRELRDKHATLQRHHRQLTKLLGKTCREIWRLKELLENAKLELKSCQKSSQI